MTAARPAAGALDVADIVIVGAGSAGCVAATALAGFPGRVVLLESGPVTVPPPAVTDLRVLPLEPGERVRRYPEARGRDVVRGAGLGGSSAINGGYFLRGHRADYAEWPWRDIELDAAFRALDGYAGSMHVRRFSDAELGPVARSFEEHWSAESVAQEGEGPWPVDGLNRVRTNAVDGRRWTAAHALLDAVPESARPAMLRATATGLVLRGGRIAGVDTDRGRIDTGAVILAAGTLGSAALVTPHLGPLRVHEHAERIVRFTPRAALPRSPLLQSVLHTPDGLEIRCYSDDFAAYIPGIERAGVPVGIADMTLPTAGILAPGGGAVDLGEPDPRSPDRMAAGVDAVVRMLCGPAFAHLVEPGSVRVDPVVGISMHAWGTLPAGALTGPDGAVAGIDGLWAVDGSILPGPLRSGPHATVMAVAALTSGRIARALGGDVVPRRD